MYSPETTVIVDPATGKYAWHFESEEIRSLRPKILALQEVQFMHTYRFDRETNLLRKAKLKQIIEDNWKELDQLKLEYEQLVRTWAG